tara:strand:+ start:4524 stop:5441 length:918 start_codon:yes stop_codon:yes gene_type:complete
MIGGLNTAILANAVSLDDEVLDWHTAISKDGGSADSDTLMALDKFMTTLKVNGVRDKIKRCNLFCGSNLRSCFHPIIKGEVGKPIGSEKDVNFGFRNSDYSLSRGLSAERLSSSALFSDASKYLKTEGFLTSFGLDNYGGHVSFMSYGSETSLSSVGGYMMPLCGGDYSMKNDLSAYVEFTDENTKAASPSSFNPSSSRGYVDLNALDGDTDVSGFWLANRTSNTDQKLYKDAVVFNDSESTLDQIPYPIGGYKFRIFSAYSGGKESQTSIGKMLFYSIGERLNESNITVLNDALTKFNDALGRN